VHPSFAHGPAPLTVERYYRDPAVRSRIEEYCGAHAGHGPSAAYVAALHPQGEPFPTWERPVRAPLSALPKLLASGSDLARSLCDLAKLILALVLE
jgi:hypothetical protein